MTSRPTSPNAAERPQVREANGLTFRAIGIPALAAALASSRKVTERRPVQGTADQDAGDDEAVASRSRT